MLSQIHKRNKERFKKKFPNLNNSDASGGFDARTYVEEDNTESTLDLIDGMVEMVEGRKKQKNDLRTFGGMGYFHQQGYNQALSDLKSLLLAQREIIENEK